MTRVTNVKVRIGFSNIPSGKRGSSYVYVIARHSATYVAIAYIYGGAGDARRTNYKLPVLNKIGRNTDFYLSLMISTRVIIPMTVLIILASWVIKHCTSFSSIVVPLALFVSSSEKRSPARSRVRVHPTTPGYII